MPDVAQVVTALVGAMTLIGGFILALYASSTKTLPPVIDLSERAISPQELAKRRATSVLWLASYSSVHRAVLVFDVSSAPEFYGTFQQNSLYAHTVYFYLYVSIARSLPRASIFCCYIAGRRGGHKDFAGRDSSRALATMSLTDTTTDISAITAKEHKTLLQWTSKFISKYPVVGYLWPESTGLSLTVPRKGTIVDAAAAAAAAGTPGSLADAAAARAEAEAEGEVAYVDPREVAAAKQAASTAATAATVPAASVSK